MTTVAYDQLQLHDDDTTETDAKNDALAELLGPLCDGTLNEWEGHNAGIYIHLNVRPGDTIQVSRDGWVRVVRRTDLGSVQFTEKDMA
jgi:hypothetical protein